MKINLYKTRKIIAGGIGILSIFAVLGIFYPIKIMDIQITPLVQRIVCDFSILALILLIGITILTIIFGRFYCSTICPFGILQECISFFRKNKKTALQGNYGFKYIIAGLTFGGLIGGSALIIRNIDPYTIFSSTVCPSLCGLFVTLAVVILVLYKNRFFCTNICPVGAILGLISKVSINKIYMNNDCIHCGQCANNCPSGCISHKENVIDNETCVKCFKCISICPKGAIKYGVKPVEFSIKRRKLLWGLGALTAIGAGYAAGINFSKNIAKKVKNIILPAGAINTTNMANKCLNCNLCINNCPNKILSKADEKFSAVHINYEKGKHYCEYNCNECSKICPSGAIKKLTLKEKQNIRIAMASISPNCVGCGHCIRVCPKGAIEITDRLAFIDGSKCIGCGKCSTVCKPNAINIFSINNQDTI